MSEDDAAEPKIERKSRMRDSRKFRALLLAIGVYVMPILMTYSLCLRGSAKVSDLIELAKWLGGAMAPVFAAYIGGVAFEKTKSA